MVKAEAGKEYFTNYGLLEYEGNDKYKVRGRRGEVQSKDVKLYAPFGFKWYRQGDRYIEIPLDLIREKTAQNIANHTEYTYAEPITEITDWTNTDPYNTELYGIQDGKVTDKLVSEYFITREDAEKAYDDFIRETTEQGMIGYSATRNSLWKARLSELLNNKRDEKERLDGLCERYRGICEGVKKEVQNIVETEMPASFEDSRQWVSKIKSKVEEIENVKNQIQEENEGYDYINKVEEVPENEVKDLIKYFNYKLEEYTNLSGETDPVVEQKINRLIAKQNNAHANLVNQNEQLIREQYNMYEKIDVQDEASLERQVELLNKLADDLQATVEMLEDYQREIERESENILGKQAIYVYKAWGLKEGGLCDGKFSQ